MSYFTLGMIHGVSAAPRQKRCMAYISCARMGCPIGHPHEGAYTNGNSARWLPFGHCEILCGRGCGGEEYQLSVLYLWIIVDNWLAYALDRPLTGGRMPMCSLGQ